MHQQSLVPFLGDVPSLEPVEFSREHYTMNLVLGLSFVKGRFAVRVADDGLTSFGLPKGAFALIQDVSMLKNDCGIYLVQYEGKVALKLVERSENELVTLRVSGDKITSLTITLDEITIVGWYEGCIHPEFAELRLTNQLELKLDNAALQNEYTMNTV